MFFFSRRKKKKDHDNIEDVVEKGTDEENLKGEISERCEKIPKGYSFYLWNKEDGYNNMGHWIEKAAKDAVK